MRGLEDKPLPKCEQVYTTQPARVAVQTLPNPRASGFQRLMSPFQLAPELLLHRASPSASVCRQRAVLASVLKIVPRNGGGTSPQEQEVRPH
jgi:hypothetical protein